MDTKQTMQLVATLERVAEAMERTTVATERIACHLEDIYVLAKRKDAEDINGAYVRAALTGLLAHYGVKAPKDMEQSISSFGMVNPLVESAHGFGVDASLFASEKV